jgi:hypothetical protein
MIIKQLKLAFTFLIIKNIEQRVCAFSITNLSDVIEDLSTEMYLSRFFTSLVEISLIYVPLALFFKF